jgi:hypothetical protein
MIIAIHQPNLFPWFGYFLKIARSSKFVFLDSVQIQKTGGSYVNRVHILEGAERRWLTLAILRAPGKSKILETTLASPEWRVGLLATIRSAYRDSAFFNEVFPSISSIASVETVKIAELNISIVRALSEMMGIGCEFLRSSVIAPEGDSTQRLIEIVLACGGDTYLSGLGGDKYQDRGEFAAAGLKIADNLFSHPRYTQGSSADFVEGLSILDMLFNIGIEATADSLAKASAGWGR